jgi:hypothetical protein
MPEMPGRDLRAGSVGTFASDFVGYYNENTSAISQMLPSIATIFIGVVAGWVAIQQLVLARHRFRLDLFDRRFKVFEATRTFLGVIWHNGTFTDDDLWQFGASTADASFLYPTEITEYLHDIRKRAINQRTLQRQFERLPAGAERSALVDREHSEFVWLTNQVETLPKRFLPYLGFGSFR